MIQQASFFQTLETFLPGCFNHRKLYCIAREHQIRNFLFGTLGHLDRFPDVGKMIKYLIPRNFTRCPGPGDHVNKIIPFGVPKQTLQVASEPVFHAPFRLLGAGLNVINQALNDF